MKTLKGNSTDPRKLALVIGNDSYHAPSNRLNHSINNANSLRVALMKMSFDVEMHTNPSTQLMELVKNFARRIEDGDLVLFYFSGHGRQVNGTNFIIPVDDASIETNMEIEDIGCNVNHILDRLVEKNPSYVTILILDCCVPYRLKDSATSKAMTDHHGLLEIPPRPGVYIQFAGAANESGSNLHAVDGHSLFTKHLVNTITNRKLNLGEVFRRVSDSVYEESKHQQKPFSADGSNELSETYLLELISVVPNIPHNAVWTFNAQTVASGCGPTSTFNKLCGPRGLYVDRSQTVFVVDSSNHRIMKYTRGSPVGRSVLGKNQSGYGPDVLWRPSDMIFDNNSNALIISDYHNRRVLRWSGDEYAETLIENISCGGLAMDDEGFLYVSDLVRHTVRQYAAGDRYGKVVAGGNGKGGRLNQLNHPTYVFVGPDQGVYVSDTWNDRVVKWRRAATEGIIVAGGNGKGKDRAQLDGPAGLIVDQLGTVYVIDQKNHRAMRWYRGASHGDIIAGDKYVAGNSASKLNEPEGLAFDSYGHLYVADSKNHRVQRFDIRSA